MTVTGKRQDSALYRWLAGAIFAFVGLAAALGVSAAPPYAVTMVKPTGGTVNGVVPLLATTSTDSTALHFTVTPDPKTGGSAFNLDGVKDGVATSWKADWNSDGKPLGDYYIKATGQSSGGGEAYSAGVKVTLTSGGGGGTVTLTKPNSGDKLSGTASLVATTSWTAESLVFVVTPSGGSPKSISATPEAGNVSWSANWDTAKETDGTYTVLARAYSGSVPKDSASVSVSLNNAAPLAVVVDAPVPAATLSGMQELKATANAAVVSMQFTVKSGSTIIATLNGTSGDGKTWTANWDTAKAANGTYGLQAKATASNATTALGYVASFVVNNVAPLTVNVTSPAASETLAGTKALAATTSETVVSVDFIVKLHPSLAVAGTVSGSSGDGKSWTANWDTTKAANGAYVIEAKATAANATTATALVSGLVVANAAPLTVSVTSPSASETLAGTKALAATTSVVADTVSFAIKSYPSLSLVGTVSGSSGDGKTWTANWDTTKAANGGYVIEAKATASGGAQTAAATVTGLVVANAAPLTVSVTSPAPNVTLDATATFTGGTSVAVGSLSFAVRAAGANSESAPLATPTATSGDGKSWTATWDTKAVANGDYKVVAIALKDGVPTASTAVPFKILNAQQQQQQENAEPVSVALTMPEQSASVSGKITLSATANQAVDSAQFTVNGPSGPVTMNAAGNGTKTVWSLAWDTTASPNGDYAVVAKVTKNGVATSSASRPFKVSNVSVSIGFTAPANGATLAGVTDVVLAAVPQASAVTVRVTSVADPGKYSDRVAKYDGTLQVWKLSVNTVDFSNQKYRLDAVATDGQGQKYYAAPITVSVLNQPSATVEREFSVKTVSPKDGGAIYGNVPLAAVVVGEPVAVKFFITPDAGGAIVSVDGRYDPERKAWVGTWGSQSHPNGAYKFGAVAYNAKNAKTESATVTANLTNKVQPVEEPRAPALSVKLVAPADGTAVGRVRLAAATEGAPTAVSFVLKRKGATDTSLVLPGTFDANEKAWIAEWDSAKADVGTYVIVASAKDAAGGRAESNSVSQYVERQANAEPPKVEPPPADLSVRIVRPTDGTTVRGPVVVAAKTDATAVRVAFFGRDVRGTQVFALAGSYSRDLGAWAAYLDTKPLKDGKYELSAAATDAAGKRAVAAVSFIVANADVAAIDKVDVIPVEAVRDAAKAQPEGTKPLATERLAPPPPDVAEKLYKECADAGIVPARCEAWLASRKGRDECRDAGIVTKEECVAFLKRAHGEVPGCDGKDEGACAEAVVKQTAGLVSADDLDRATKAIDKHVGRRIAVPPTADDGGEKEKPSADDVLAYIPISRREGLNLDVHASPAFVRTDDETSHRSVPAVLFIDADADGLPDDAEKRFGTKPDVADTDGDGFTDGDEVKNGYNPLGRGRLTDGVSLSPVDVAIVSGAPIEQPKSAGEETDALKVDAAEQQDEGEVVRITGKARPHEVVTLFVYSYLPVVLTTEADENGDWSYDLGATLDDGQHEVYVAVTDETGKIKEKGSPLAFFVAGAQAASADEFFKNEPAETSPTAAAIAAEPIRQSMLPYAVATFVLLALAGVIAFLLFRPKSDGAPPS